MSPTLAAALDYAARGWPVLPVKPDKKPLTEHGLKDATIDAETIKAWWERWPHAGVAITTGAVSGVVVLDIDIDHEKGKDGLATLDELGISTHPETLTAHTPRGGIHCFYVHPGFDLRNSASKVGPDLDVRGEGGYCVVPPGSGRFWDPHLGLDIPLASMPEWMVPKRAEAPGRKPQESRRIAQRLSAYCEAALDGAVKDITGAQDGRRYRTLNDAAFSIGRLAGSGTMPPAIALDVLIWAGRQIPNFSDHDPEKIVRNAFMDGLRQPREVPHG
jgi:hypothetical protein